MPDRKEEIHIFVKRISWKHIDLKLANIGSLMVTIMTCNIFQLENLARI